MEFPRRVLTLEVNIPNAHTFDGLGNQLSKNNWLKVFSTIIVEKMYVSLGLLPLSLQKIKVNSILAVKIYMVKTVHGLSRDSEK